MAISDRPDLMRWLRMLVLGTLAVAVLVLFVASSRLWSDYRPAPYGDPRIVDGYRTASRTLIAIGTVLVVLRCTIWRLPSRRGTVPIVVTAVGTVLVGVSMYTFGRVLWDGVGMWAVAAIDNYAGVGRPAFSDEVRSVIVGSSEMSPGAYGCWLIAHGVITAAGAAAIVIGALWPLAQEPRQVPGKYKRLKSARHDLFRTS